jgi:hypothetical protein
MKAPDFSWESWQFDHAIIWNLTVLTQRKEGISLLNHVAAHKNPLDIVEGVMFSE